MYTGVLPERLQIAHGRGGKPFLHAAPDDNLRFSLSHSSDLVVYAICWGSEIGVDLEFVAPRHSDPELWPHALTPRELAVLESLPADTRPKTFARIWTHKEAVLKATGRGIAYPLSQLELAEKAIGGTAVAELDGVWYVKDVPAPESGFVAAVATRPANPLLLTRTALNTEGALQFSEGRTM